jgi:hypothetical protein
MQLHDAIDGSDQDLNALTAEGVVADRTGSPYVILSDTAAIPARCLGTGLGLDTISATTPATLVIKARGGEADNPIDRQGAGDVFVVTVLRGAEFLPEHEPVLTYIGQGSYECTYAATSSDHLTTSWDFYLQIKLADPDDGILRDISGSPFAVQMTPAETAARFSYAEGSTLHQAYAGATSAFWIYGKDAYNNRVFVCTDGFAATLSLVGHRNCVSMNADCAYSGISIPAAQRSCSNAEYLMEYETDIAAGYSLVVTFNGENIEESPFSVTAGSADISAGNSYLSPSERLDGTAAALVTGDVEDLVAGELLHLYMHAFDRFDNILTQAACEPISVCANLDFQWCNSKKNLTLYFTDTVRTACQNSLRCSNWPETLGSCTTTFNSMNGEPGLYTVDFELTRAGTSILSASVDESDATVSLMNSGVALVVVPAAAWAQSTIASPSTISVGGEEISFSIRAFDTYRNLVVDPNLGFSIVYRFPCDNVDGKTAADDCNPIDDTEQMIIQPDTTVVYVPQDGSYKATYVVETGGKSMNIELSVLLDGVSSGTLYTILVRAAKNKPKLCYVLTNEVGPVALRLANGGLGLSPDLHNVNNKKAGDDMAVTVQSMAKTLGQDAAPRSGLSSLCTQDQIDSFDTQKCDELDEFTAVLILKSDNTVRFDDTSEIICTDTTRPADEPEDTWIMSDCARDGQYRLHYSATVSGLYELRITSFGLMIQTSDESNPPHDFVPPNIMPVDVFIREQQIGGSGGSLEPPGPLLEPPGPLLTHLHPVYIAHSERLPTRLNPLAERACFSQVFVHPATMDAENSSEKDAKLAQKLGQLQPFLAVFPQECMGQLASFGPT